MGRFSWLAAALAGASIAGCAGNGEGLDQNGRPISGEPPPLVPEFQSIQDNVFTPICTACHAGAAAPLGLRLDEGASYAMLVNAPSAEAPDLNRVTPGDPDASYLIQKLEGRAAVGDRMPLGGPALPAETIDVIRQWIADGAQPPSAEGMSATGSTKLTPIDPLPGAVLQQRPGAVVLAADGELDTTRLDGGTIRVEASGGDGGFDDGNEIAMTGLKFQVRTLAPTVFAIATPATWPGDRYRLVIAGGGADPLRDRNGNAIDGDGDGHPGGDFTLEFELRSPQ